MYQWAKLNLIMGILAVMVSVAQGAVKQSPPNASATAIQGVKKPEPVVMLRVNGKALTVQDYASFLQRNPAYVQAAMNSKEGKSAAIRAMVGGVLIKEQLMRQEGLLPNKEKSSPQELSAAYEKLAEQNFPIPSAADEQTLYQYYQDHQKEFGLPEMVRISQILFKYPEHATDEQKKAAREKAEKALIRLEAGEDFGKLAGELTENPQAKLPKGDLGYLVRDTDAWLKDAVKGVKVGERTGVLESPAGYEILLVTDSRPAIITPYANVRDKVIQILKDQEQSKARDVYIGKLAKTAKIEVIQPELKPLFSNGVFP